MKTLKNNFKSILFFGFCIAMLTAAKCDSEDPEPEQNENPCSEFTCQNDGVSYYDVEFQTCRCNCPTGFTGEHCETMN